MFQCSKKTIKLEDFNEFISSFNLSLTAKQSQYIISTIYKQNRNLSKLPTDEIIKLFKNIIFEYEELKKDTIDIDNIFTEIKNHNIELSEEEKDSNSEDAKEDLLLDKVIRNRIPGRLEQ